MDTDVHCDTPHVHEHGSIFERTNLHHFDSCTLARVRWIILPGISCWLDALKPSFATNAVQQLLDDTHVSETAHLRLNIHAYASFVKRGETQMAD